MPKIVVLMLSFSAIAAGNILAQVDIQNPKTARDSYERGLERENAKDFAEALADYQIAGLLEPRFLTRTSLLVRSARRRKTIAARLPP